MFGMVCMGGQARSRFQEGFSMATKRPNTETVLQERTRQEMADSFDEELEMEIDDDRLD